MSTQSKRTIAPIFWLLFGAGGMLSALFGAGLVILSGFLLPAAPPTYHDAFAAAHNPLIKLIFLSVVSLFFWHGAERLYLTLHDMRAGPKRLLKLVSYGLAACLTLVTLFLLLTIGFRP